MLETLYEHTGIDWIRRRLIAKRGPCPYVLASIKLGTIKPRETAAVPLDDAGWQQEHCVFWAGHRPPISCDPGEER